jgi:hypothetical protein
LISWKGNRTEPFPFIGRLQIVTGCRIIRLQSQGYLILSSRIVNLSLGGTGNSPIGIGLFVIGIQSQGDLIWFMRYYGIQAKGLIVFGVQLPAGALPFRRPAKVDA